MIAQQHGVFNDFFDVCLTGKGFVKHGHIFLIHIEGPLKHVGNPGPVPA